MVEKTFRKIKLRRMSGIPSQYLDTTVRYGVNIKYRN